MTARVEKLLAMAASTFNFTTSEGGQHHLASSVGTFWSGGSLDSLYSSIQLSMLLKTASKLICSPLCRTRFLKFHIASIVVPIINE